MRAGLYYIKERGGYVYTTKPYLNIYFGKYIVTRKLYMNIYSGEIKKKGER